MMLEEKRNIIYKLMGKIENKEHLRNDFIQWFRKMSWYIDAGIPFSEDQLDEIISYLEYLIER